MDGGIPLTTGKMHQVLSCLSSRLDFQPGKTIIASLGLPTSVGWEKTIVGVMEALPTRPSASLLLNKLHDAFTTHCMIGEKLISYFGFSGLPKQVKTVHDNEAVMALLKQDIPQSAFRNVYPLAIFDQDELKALDGLPPVLTAIEGGNGKVAFHFCSVRSFHERILIDTNRLGKDDREYLSEYTELYGVKAVRRQCFDSVIYDSSRQLVELRTDSPDGMSVVQKRNGLHAVRNAFHSLGVFASGWSPFGGSSYNFHDLMKKLYATAEEGNVFQLGFTASTKDASSNNGAKLLRRKGVDLRKDPFHQGGKKEVKDLSPYTIGVEWTSSQFMSQPKLIVPGSVKMLYKPPISFPEVIVRDCYTSQQFDFVTGKIDKYR